MTRALAVMVGIGVLVAGLAAANYRRDSSALEIDWQLMKPPPREVNVEPATRGAIVQTITAPGVVESVEEAEIASQVVGRVVEVRVKDGDPVKKGDLLVKLDDTEARARVDSSEARIKRLTAAIAQVDSDLEKARRDVNRLTQLAGRNASSPTELADARSALTRATATLAMGRGDLAESEALKRTSLQDLDRTEIRAPIDGVVAGLKVEVGEIIIPGTPNLPGAVLMTVGDPSRMRIRADVDETDVSLVHSGQPARVYLQSDLTRGIAGRVDRVAPKGKKSEEVVSFETLVTVDAADDALRPGMTATVEIEVRQADDALGVPVQAVVHRRRKDLPDTTAVRAWAERHAHSPGEKAQDAEARYIKIVFVVDGDSVRARPVETGLSDERRVEILSGLKPDERVVVGPFRALDELKDGHPVTRAKAGGEGPAS